MIKEVPGFPGYRADSRGFVIGKRGWPLKPRVTHKGTRGIQLCKDGKVHWRIVGRVILETFVGPTPEGCECCHGELGRDNDSLDNLSWGTRSQNNGADKHRDGTMQSGERNGQSKLTLADVSAIRNGLAKGKTMVSLAAEFGVSDSTIHRIKTGKSWSR